MYKVHTVVCIMVISKYINGRIKNNKMKAVINLPAKSPQTTRSKGLLIQSAKEIRNVIRYKYTINCTFSIFYIYIKFTTLLLLKFEIYDVYVGRGTIENVRRCRHLELDTDMSWKLVIKKYKPSEGKYSLITLICTTIRMLYIYM